MLCFKPNCYVAIVKEKKKDKLMIFSKNFIKKYDELTIKYNFQLEDDINKKLKCKCGNKEFCNGFMN